MSTGPLEKNANAATEGAAQPPIDLTKPPGPLVPSQEKRAVTHAGSPAERPAARERPMGTQAGPAWIVIPARVIAVVIVLPLRLVYDLAAAGVRGLKRTPGWVGRMLRAAYLAVVHPVVRLIGRGALALWSGVAWLWTRGVYRPLRWLTVDVIWGGLRLLGRGIGLAASWFTSVFLAPIGRFLVAIGSALIAGLRWLGSGFGRILDLLIIRPVTAVWRGIAWCFKQLGTGLWFVLRGLGTGLKFLGNVLIVIPAVALWQYVLRPPLLGLAWLGRVVGGGIARGFQLLATGIVAVWGIFAGALVWAWRMLGRLLYWIARILFVIPALALYRYVLRPIGQGIAVAWRFTGRWLRRLWKYLVVAPARAVKKGVLDPIGRGIRATWRVTVRDPARWVRESVLHPIRETARDVRLQFRRVFGRDTP